MGNRQSKKNVGIESFYEYNPDNMDRPLFTLIAIPSPGTGYKYRKDIGSGSIKVYENVDHFVKIYFNPSVFPRYDRIVEILKITPRNQLREAIISLYIEKRSNPLKKLSWSVVEFLTGRKVQHTNDNTILEEN